MKKSLRFSFLAKRPRPPRRMEACLAASNRTGTCAPTQIRIDLGVREAEDDGDGSPFSTAWKAVWMTLMICCAARQLLSCIQALISMSSLSSGVIADAAGKDMQRRHPRSRRSSGGGGSSRGRSRSRAR
ncbi:unnamed protein product [Ectocarpus sp. 8 AP-2014]